MLSWSRLLCIWSTLYYATPQKAVFIEYDWQFILHIERSDSYVWHWSVMIHSVNEDDEETKSQLPWDLLKIQFLIYIVYCFYILHNNDKNVSFTNCKTYCKILLFRAFFYKTYCLSSDHLCHIIAKLNFNFSINFNFNWSWV